MTLSELITASRVNGWNVVDEILYQTYLDTLAGSGGINEQILNALQTFGSGIGFEYIENGRIFLDENPVDLVSTLDASVLAFVGGNFYNPNNVPVFVKFCDVAAVNVTVGTTSIQYSFMIPALGQVVLDSNTFYHVNQDIAMSYYVVTGYSNADTTAPTLAIVASSKMYKNTQPNAEYNLPQPNR